MHSLRHETSVQDEKKTERNTKTSSSLSLPPRILLLDMDGTMIGKITPQVCEYEVILTTDEKKLKSMKADLVERLKQGIIRPYLASLCRLVAAGELTNVELFVYTASETRWAHFLIPCIEEALGFRFNRPFFTRDHCVAVGSEYKKAFELVAPAVFRKLRGKYALANFRQTADNMALIDNNPTVLLYPNIDGRKTVKCPTYNFAYYYDVLARLPAHTVHESFAELVPVLALNDMFPDVPPRQVEDVHHFLLLYFQKMNENVRTSWKEMKAAGKERLFRLLIAALRTNQKGTSVSHPASHASFGITTEFVTSLERDIAAAMLYSSPLRTSSTSSTRERDHRLLKPKKKNSIISNGNHHQRKRE